MRFSLAESLAVIACLAGLASPRAAAAVDLELRANPRTVGVDSEVEVGLYAVSSEATTFSGLDVILSWDAEALELVGFVDNPSVLSPRFMSGFLSDEFLDGLNADCGPNLFCETFGGLPFNDGDAYYQAVSFNATTASVDGVLVATFTFRAIALAQESGVSIPAQAGNTSVTKVLQPEDGDVTGSLRPTDVTVTDVRITALDVSVPAGRVASLDVAGEIFGAETFGITVSVELSGREGNLGTVTFTSAPPGDIEFLADPWSGSGNQYFFDTDFVGSPVQNGAALDNGTFLPEPLNFSETLVRFPLIASPDAVGAWDLRLCAGPCEGAGSWWDAPVAIIPTVLDYGVLRVVELGDGDGSEAIDFRDFAELQACFTGSADSPVFSKDPALRCVVYDFDDDGDVDADDYQAFHFAFSGLTP